MAEANITGRQVGSASSTDIGTSALIVYIVGIFSGIPLGYLALRINGTVQKQLFNLASGVALLLWITEANAFYPVVLAMTVFLLMRLLPKSLSPHGLAFAFTVAWCFFYRTTHWWFPEWPSKSPPTGAIMMIVQYRVISAAFDVCATPLKMGRGPDAELEKQVPMPTALLYFSYVFSFSGLVAGPIITFADYVSYVKLNPTRLNAEAESTLRSRGVFAATVIGLWVAMMLTLPKARMEVLMTGWQGVRNAVGLFAWLSVASLHHRFQFYGAWVVGEVGMVLAGIGTTHQGGYSFKMVQNIEPVEIEINSWYLNADKPYSIAHQVKHWNMSVQRWLVRYVYRRFPVKFFAPLATMMISAYLHGIAIGFYVSFAFILVLDMVQKKWMNIDWTPPFKHIAIIRWTYMAIYYMVLMRSMEYIVAPFHAPFATLGDIFTMWSSFGFVVHIGAFGMMLMILIMPQKDKPLKKVYSHVDMASRARTPTEPSTNTEPKKEK